MGTVGMGLRSASVTKVLLESTVVRMTVVMKMCLPQSQKNLAVLARIQPNLKTNILYVTFIPTPHLRVHVVVFSRNDILTYSDRHFIELCISVIFIWLYCFFIQTEITFDPLFRPILCHGFFYTVCLI